MNASFDTQSPTEGILTLHLNPQDYQATWEKNITYYKQKVNLKGFRKGHAPNASVKKMYGQQLLEESIFQVAYQALLNYVKEYQLHTLGAPLLTQHNIHTISAQQPTPCTISYRIGLTPEFELPDPTQLNVQAYQITTVEDDNLNEIIEEIQKSYATFQQVDTAQPNHILYGHLLVNNQPTQDPYYIHLNDQTTTLHPLFLEKKVDTTLTLTPDALHTLDNLNPLPEKVKQDLRNTPKATFAFHIQTIYHRQLPPLDKNFYTKVLGATIETEDEFRKNLAQIIVQRDQQQADKLLHNTLRETFIAAAHIPLPDEILKVWLQTKQEKPIDPQELTQQYPLYAQAIRWDLLLDKIAEAHQLQPTPQEVQERLIQYLQADNKEQGQQTTNAELQEKAQNLLQNKETNLSERIARQLREEKALQIIKEKVNIQNTPINSREFYAIIQPKKN